MQEIVASDAPTPQGAYSQGVAAGDLVFTAGMGPVDPATGAVVGTDIAEQTQRTLENIRAILGAAGLDLTNVVKVTAHLQYLRRDFAGYDRVYRAYFTAPYPVRTTVGSDLMDILVEIDVVAIRDDRSQAAS
ncbi:MAG TPA: Rid family detoxifying hydrolase [Micromonosporaceae bacterium]|jgi:2-iminobutanoate/2-iminopropanoate deaminase